ncbi:MAG TPA: Rieske 2Fe-2S domain-containing protein [Elusimicrobiota bacterium]|nr:Rieske 2Fe-2S domain-containing protein [Elusimicrobiota bacterium]
MSEKVRVAALNEIPPGKSLAVKIAETDIALFNVDGRLYAVRNACPHRNLPIHDGKRDGTKVVCPWHSWIIELQTGAVVAGPDFHIKTYPISVTDDYIHIEI